MCPPLVTNISIDYLLYRDKIYIVYILQPHGHSILSRSSPELPQKKSVPPAELLAELKGAGLLTCTVPEAAKIIGIGRNAGYAAARSGELPTVKFGHRIVVPVSAIELILGVK